MRMLLIFDLFVFACFFGHGEAEVCRFWLWRFVSGPYSKIQDSSPVMTPFQGRTVVFNLPEKIQTPVTSVVLLILRRIFRNRFRADFPRLHVIGQNLMNGDASESQLFTDRSDRQPTITSHEIPDTGDVFVVFCS